MDMKIPEDGMSIRGMVFRVQFGTRLRLGLRSGSTLQALYSLGFGMMIRAIESVRISMKWRLGRWLLKR